MSISETTAPDVAELLPCPFCGGKAEIINIEEGENAGGSCVCCTKCNASGNVEFGFKENFISNWNRRLAKPQEAAPVTVQAAAKVLLGSLSSHDADTAETLLWAKAWRAMNPSRDDWYGLREALRALASGPARQDGGEG